MSACEHLKFEASCIVARLTDGEGGPVKSYAADLTIKCADCGHPFMFLGLPAGYIAGGAAVSVDGLEARLSICPDGERASALGEIAQHMRQGKPN